MKRYSFSANVASQSTEPSDPCRFMTAIPKRNHDDVHRFGYTFETTYPITSHQSLVTFHFSPPSPLPCFCERGVQVIGAGLSGSASSISNFGIRRSGSHANDQPPAKSFLICVLACCCNQVRERLKASASPFFTESQTLH
jgi:hypothetical protein